MPKASAKNGQVCDAPARVTRSSPTATSASIAIETIRMVRRGYRSARWPAGSASSGSGRNIARPTIPRSSGSRWIEYTCQPTATNDISIAKAVATVAPR